MIWDSDLFINLTVYIRMLFIEIIRQGTNITDVYECEYMFLFSYISTQKEDGQRLKGRGSIQLTGRANYRAAGTALGFDLLNHPEKVKTPKVGFRTSVWF